MQRIDASFLYNVGSQIHPLAELHSSTKLNHCIWTVYLAQTSLEGLLSSVFRLRTSREPTERLLASVRELSRRCGESQNNDDEIGFSVHGITSQLTAFEAVLAAEFRVSAIYLVTQKKALDAAVMIESGADAFPDDLLSKVPEAGQDVRDAARCLVFELPTAAGFHLHRANESVLHKYYDAVTNGAARPTNRNMGDYLNALSTANAGTPEVRAALRDLKDLHRNPLIHPDHSLDNVDQAYALYCAVFTAMEAMLRAIPVPAPLPPAPPTDEAT